MLKILLCLLIICVLLNGIYSGHEKSKPFLLNPTTFVDLNKPFYEFSCEQEIENKQWISWYQKKHMDLYPTYLKTLQAHKNGAVKINLVLPLDVLDKDSVIYCITHSERIQDDGEKVFTEISKSHDIRISFNTDNYPSMKPVTPQVSPSKFFDRGDPVVDYTCWGYLSQTLNWQRLAWYQVKDEKLILFNRTELETYYGYTKVVFRKILEPSDVGTYIYCAIENGNYMEMYKSDPIRFNVSRTPTEVWGPRVDPVIFLNDGSSLKMIESNCTAYLYEGELLTWFQENDPIPITRLAMTQQRLKYEKIILTLQKTLESTDKDSIIYCAKETVQNDGFGYLLNTEIESGRIQIQFDTQINSLERPYVQVDPSSGIKILENGKALNLTCSVNVFTDSHSLTWYLEGRDVDKPTGATLRQHRKNNRTYLVIRMNQALHMTQLFCAAEYQLDIVLPDSKEIIYYHGEIARSYSIKLLLQGYHASDDQPQVTSIKPPEGRFINPQLLVYDCYAFLKPYQVVSWYQSAGTGSLSPSQNILLSTFQLQDIRTSGQWIKFNLKKTPVNSDYGTYIYCSTQNVMEDGDFSATGERKSISTLITFQGNIASSQLSITTDPSSDVHFEVNTTQRFKCNGTYPVDDRSYIWFRVDRDHNITIPKNQNYNTSTNLNILEVFFDESFNHTQLYCAQIFISDIIDNKGVRHQKYYNEIIKSKALNLIRRAVEQTTVQTSSFNSDNRNILLGVLIPALVALVTALIYWGLRRRLAKSPTVTPSPTGTPQRPKPKPKPNPTPKETKTPRPAIAPRPNLPVHSTSKTNLAPTLTPNPTPILDQGNGDPLYGNSIKLSADMESHQVTYAVLDLPRIEEISTRNFSAPKTSHSVDGRDARKTSDSRSAPKISSPADSRAAQTSGRANNTLNASNKVAGTKTFATSESSPYAQIIGVYRPN